MKSLEALEILRECANGENKVLFSTSLELANTIKQDLERLVELERDILAFEDELYDNDCEIKLLKKENENLKKDYVLLKRLEEIDQKCIEEYRKVFDKYQKAIEILKENVLFEFYEPQSEQEMHDCFNHGEEPFLIRLGEEWFTLEDYKKFLKAGSTLNPIDSLKLAGVDLTNKEVIESAIKMFDDTINEFKELYTESK